MPATQASSEADRILRRRQVRERTGLSDTTLWRYEKKEKFPKRIVLSDSGRLVGWRESEVTAWIADRVRGFGRPPNRGGGRRRRQIEILPASATSTVMLELPSARSIFPDLDEREVILGCFDNGGIVTFKPARRQVRGASDDRRSHYRHSSPG